MSYTPEHQLLEPPMRELLEAIDKTNNALNARIDDNEWMESHIQECAEWVSRLTALRMDIKVFLRSTQ